MELKEFLFLIKRKHQTIIVMMLIAVLAVAGLSLLFPLRYEAQSRVLITQESGSADAYTVSRSNEYLGNLFAQVVLSSSFFDLTMNSPYNVDQNYFQGNYAKKMKAWRQAVKTRTLSDTGIIEISIYHTSPYQAQQIALAVNEAITSKNTNYQANGDKVKINVIDQPLISNYPVKPNILQNTLLAAIFSFIFALFYIYILPEDRYSWHLFKSKKYQRRQQIQEAAANAVWSQLPQVPLNNDYHPNSTPSKSNSANNQFEANVQPRGSMNNILK